MPGSLLAWYSLYDLETLGEREALLGGELELKQLTRLQDLLHSDAGSVNASLKFRRHRTGCVTVDLEYETTLEIVCQRCLEPMARRVSECISLALLESEAMETNMPEGFEPVVLPVGRLQPAGLLEDELIIALPLSPRHPRIEECGKLAQNVEALMITTEPGAVAPPSRGH